MATGSVIGAMGYYLRCVTAAIARYFWTCSQQPLPSRSSNSAFLLHYSSKAAAESQASPEVLRAGKSTSSLFSAARRRDQIVTWRRHRLSLSSAAAVQGCARSWCSPWEEEEGPLTGWGPAARRSAPKLRRPPWRRGLVAWGSCLLPRRECGWSSAAGGCSKMSAGWSWKCCSACYSSRS